MKILVLSDIHYKYKNIVRIPEIEKVDLVIIAGDLTHFGGQVETREVVSFLNEKNIPFLAIPGNVDDSSVLEYLEQLNVSLHGQGRKIGNVGFFGCGGSNKTPMKTPTEFSEEEIIGFLEEGYAAVADVAVKVMVVHAPPKNYCDKTFLKQHVGCPSIKDFIVKHEIALCLCGHIHEAKGIDNFAQTIIVNPGCFKHKNYALIELAENINVSLEKL